MKCSYVGAQRPTILFVGEAPGSNEEKEGFGLVAASGDMMLDLLVEAGVLPDVVMEHMRRGRGKTFGHLVHENLIQSFGITNVSQIRPPSNNIDKFFYRRGEGKKIGANEIHGKFVSPEIEAGLEELRRDIAEHDPEIVVGLGAVALWACTGQGGTGWSPAGIVSWQGSQMRLLTEGPYGFHRAIPFLPIIHPAGIMRQYSWKFITRHHLSTRLVNFLSEGEEYWTPPEYDFHIRPTFDQAVDWLTEVLRVAEAGGRVAVDIETAYHSYITCIGFATSPTKAYCIPLSTRTHDAGYWTVDQECSIRWLVREILTCPTAHITGQSYEYDREYLTREFLCKPRLTTDTRTRHHVAFPLLPAGLHYLSSMYAYYHLYWKDENKEASRTMDEDLAWEYNCKDCAITWEVDEALDQVLEGMGLTEQAKFEMELHDAVYHMHQRGVRRDDRLCEEWGNWNLLEQFDRAGYLEAIAGRTLSANSDKPWHGSPQQTMTLFYEIFAVNPVLDKKSKRPTSGDDALPIIAAREPLLRPIVKRLEELRSLRTMMSTVLRSKTRGGRWVTQFTIPGTITFRFSSSKNGYEEGLNLQNITAGDDPDDPRFENLLIPNLRRLFKPDPGMIKGDVDLDRADLQVVVWEADDDDLKTKLRAGVDIHASNAADIGCTRQDAKAGVHLTNYGGTPPTLARTLGISRLDAHDFQKSWFDAHPGILEWHKRTQAQLEASRSVTNAFGFTAQFFDRIDDLLPQALAWVPQSTVAIVINKGLLRLHKYFPEVEPLLQVHDSVTIQWPKDLDPWIRPEIRSALEVTVPYSDPLIIPVGLKASEVSWGDCKEVSWTPWLDRSI